MIHANDFSFFEDVNEIVQHEPTEALDPERAGQLAAISIVPGQPFEPDERLRSILDTAARVASGMPRTSRPSTSTTPDAVASAHRRPLIGCVEISSPA